MPVFVAERVRRRRGCPLDHILEYIDGHLHEPLSLTQLAELAGLSVWRFATVFRQRMGQSPYRYICRRRVERAQQLLSQGVPPARVAGETGFYDQSHLSRRFKSLCGMTPGQFAARMQG